MPEELWMEVHDIVQEAELKTIHKIKKCKNAKWLSEEALQLPEKRREVKGKEERYIQLMQNFREQQREIRRPSSMNSAKKQRETIKWERLEISSRKLEIRREYFMQR